MHGQGPRRVPHNRKYISISCEKPRGGGTLESIVHQATIHPCSSPNPPHFNRPGGAGLRPCFDPCHPTISPMPNPIISTSIMDALVLHSKSLSNVVPAVGPTPEDHRDTAVRTRVSVSSGRTGTGSASFQMMDTPTSPENSVASTGKPFGMTSSADVRTQAKQEARGEEVGKNKGTTESNHKCPISTKRRRAAINHKQSERKRRDRINGKIKSLQRLIPNSSKTDKASILDEAIEYMKQLQAQVHMMSTANASYMMLQQQFQMPTMSPTSSMGMCIMDMNTLGRFDLPVGFHPTAFMPQTPRQAFGDWFPTTIAQDPFSTLFTCASHCQTMTLDAHSRMSALYQQLHQYMPVANQLPRASPHFWYFFFSTYVLKITIICDLLYL